MKFSTSYLILMVAFATTVVALPTRRAEGDGIVGVPADPPQDLGSDDASPPAQSEPTSDTPDVPPQASPTEPAEDEPTDPTPSSEPLPSTSLGSSDQPSVSQSTSEEPTSTAVPSATPSTDTQSSSTSDPQPSAPPTPSDAPTESPSSSADQAPPPSSPPAPSTDTQPTPTSSASSSSSRPESTPVSTPRVERQVYLNLHNAIRKDVNMPALEWSKELQEKAQAYAEGCQLKHSDGALGPVGENLAAGTGSFSASKAVRLFVEDEGDLNADFSFSHFTQVIWKSTTKLGCGVAKCDNMFPDHDGPATYHVCLYDPVGNVVGEEKENLDLD